MQFRVVGLWGGFPKQDGPCSGYLIEKDGFTLLVDCGSGVAQAVQQYKELTEIDHIVISHYHYDHFSDVGVMQFGRLVNTQLKLTDAPLTVYGPENEEVRKRIEEIPRSEFKGYTEDSVLHIGPFTIEFLANVHPVEAYAMRISDGEKTIVYTADTSFTEELVDFAAGADLLITECSLYEGMDGTKAGHINAQEAGVLARDSGSKKVLLTHLPHYGDLDELVVSAKKQEAENVRLAEVGMVVEV
jgi:ribonuclease BN (tRNA processing enzyme)